MNKVSSIGIIIVLSVVIYLFFIQDKLVNGNDEASIVKTIHSIGDYEGPVAIEVLKIIDIEDNRMVAFLYNGAPGYIQFLKNEMENYEWKSMEKRDNQTTELFNVNLINESTEYSPKLMIVSNYNNNIAKVKIIVNGTVIEKKLAVGEPSVEWVEFPKSTDKSWAAEYEFYDKDGKRIENSEF
ncbi:MAG: hypothetical protein ACI35O_13635 [Bacillaceae bacterium]